MNRDDILRELELLPMWQLRVALPQAELQSAPRAEAPIAEAPIAASPAPAPVLAAAQTFRLLVGDADYLFLLENTQNQEEEALLQNMLKAIAGKPRVDIAAAGIQEILEQPCKIIVAMGEAAAHALLGGAESIAALRGKLHQYQQLPVVVTYHPAHLLLHLPDKAKAWQDLCLAKASLA